MGHTAEVDRFLIRTAAGQAGIADHGGQITRNAPALGPGVSPIKGHTVVTDTKPSRSQVPTSGYSKSDKPGRERGRRHPSTPAQGRSRPGAPSLGAMAMSGGPWPPAADSRWPPTSRGSGSLLGARSTIGARRSVASCACALPRRRGVCIAVRWPGGPSGRSPCSLVSFEAGRQHSQIGGWLPLICDHTLALPMRGNALQFNECWLTRVNKSRSEVAVDHASGRRRRLDESTRRPNGGFGTSSIWPQTSSTTCVVSPRWPTICSARSSSSRRRSRRFGVANERSSNGSRGPRGLPDPPHRRSVRGHLATSAEDESAAASSS